MQTHCLGRAPEQFRAKRAKSSPPKKGPKMPFFGPPRGVPGGPFFGTPKKAPKPSRCGVPAPRRYYDPHRFTLLLNCPRARQGWGFLPPRGGKRGFSPPPGKPPKTGFSGPPGICPKFTNFLPNPELRPIRILITYKLL